MNTAMDSCAARCPQPNAFGSHRHKHTHTHRTLALQTTATTAQPQSVSYVETPAAAAAAPTATSAGTAGPTPASSVATPLAQGDAASGVADSVAAAADAGDKEADDMAVCITVHPPPRFGGGALVLEPLAGVELVMQVRQLLGEIPQTCLFSAFQLVAVGPKEGGGGGGVEDQDVWKREGEVMNDYVELRSIGAVAACPSKVEVSCERAVPYPRRWPWCCLFFHVLFWLAYVRWI